MEYVSLFETPYGRGAVMAGEVGVRSVMLPHETLSSSIKRGLFSGMRSSDLTESAAEMLFFYFKGEPQQFEKIAVDLMVSGAFRRKVLQLIRMIPHGVVKSYGEVAGLTGSPHSARAVGGAMAANPVPIIIPCHRVISSGGRLTGYTAPGGLELKKKLLQMEGVEFKGELICQAKT